MTDLDGMIDEICETMEGDRPPSRHVWHFSVSAGQHIIVHALVPSHYKKNALNRLRMDDELWYSRTVKCHGKEMNEAVVKSGRIKFEGVRT